MKHYELRAIKTITDGDELYIEYGKHYWCYLPHFETLNEGQKEKCILYYEIDVLVDMIEAPAIKQGTAKPVAAAVAATPSSPVNSGGKDAGSPAKRTRTVKK